MKLQAYIKAVDGSTRQFSARSGVAARTLDRICLGYGCRTATARQIVRATLARPAPDGGTVGLEDLVDDRPGARSDRVWDRRGVTAGD